MHRKYDKTKLILFECLFIMKYRNTNLIFSPLRHNFFTLTLSYSDIIQLVVDNYRQYSKNQNNENNSELSYAVITSNARACVIFRWWGWLMYIAHELLKFRKLCSNSCVQTFVFSCNFWLLTYHVVILLFRYFTFCPIS